MVKPNGKKEVGDIGRLLGSTQPITADYRSMGTTGLRRFGGYVFESTLTKLTGRQAMEAFKEMGEVDPSCGVILFLIQNIVRGVKWYIEPSGEAEADIEASEFLETCLHDLDVPFTDVISEILSKVQYGFSVHEIVLKRRCGRAPEPWMRSKYTDGRISWRGLPIRAQETVQQWEFDESGTLTAMIQMDPATAKLVRIPMDKLLLFRTSTHKNNPEGLSAFRRCYRPYYLKRGIENCEAVGLERDLAGLPMAYVDASIMSDDADDDAKALLQTIRDVVTRTRRDEQEGIVFPRMRDEQGNDMFEFKLLNSGGARQFNTTAIIERYDVQILRSALAEFLALGQGGNSGGSFAMHGDKREMFVGSLETYLGQITEVFNRHAIPRLMELNGFAVTDYPKLAHTPIEQVDQKGFSESLRNLTQAGFPISTDKEVYKRVMEVFGFPAPLESNVTEREDSTMPAYVTGGHDKIREVPSDEAVAGGADAEGYDRPLGEHVGQKAVPSLSIPKAQS